MAYELHFGCKIGDQYELWAPYIYCSKCAVNLRGYLNGKLLLMVFAVRMALR
jgi:hypothetical protein